MFFYRIAKLILQSQFEIQSFGNFACKEEQAGVVLESTDVPPQPGQDIVSGSIVHRAQPDGWFFHSATSDQAGLFVSSDYTRLLIKGLDGSVISGMNEWFVRIALECWLARNGYVSLHSAAVAVNSMALAFTAPSGVGKSTRAKKMIESMGAELINGDRPLISVEDQELYGVPWDGKEQCFRNEHFPLWFICEVRRSSSVYIRNLSFKQRRKLLIRQCFMPMWDMENATIQMANITRMAKEFPIIRIFCGPEEKDVLALYGALQKQNYLREESDMKAKSGFILRHVVDEYILMPTGDNIGKFNGTVLLNEVSAMVWEKLQTPMTKEDLLQAILDEYEVDKATASADLDKLLITLRNYGVIEDD